jgi:hypothetical protein
MKKQMKKVMAFLKQAKDNKLALSLLVLQLITMFRMEQAIAKMDAMFNGMVGGLMMMYMSLTGMMAELAKLVQQGA